MGTPTTENLNARYLAPRVLQLVGVAGFIATLAFWIISGKQSLMMMSGCLSLIGLGQYSKSGDRLLQLASQATQQEPPA